MNQQHPIDRGPATARDAYTERAGRYAAEAARLTGRSDRLSNLRVATCLPGLIAIALGWLADKPWQNLWWIAAAVLLVAFAGLVAWHRRVLVARDRANSYLDLNEEGLARLDRRWAALRPAAAPSEIQADGTARDLDYFGQASLFQLACTTRTYLGKQLLAGWLIHPAEPPEIKRRQEAVANLAGALDFRQELDFCGARRGEFPAVAPLLNWAEGPRWLTERRWLLWASHISPLVLVMLAAAALAGWPVGMLWLVVPMFNLALTVLAAGDVHEIFRRVCSRENELEQYARLFEAAARTPGDAYLVRRVRGTLQTGQHGAYREVDRLRRIMTLADLRFSPMIYAPIQALTMWDIHVLWAVERWQARVGPHVREWFEALAELEALCSLASLAHDHPDWAFAEVVTGDDVDLQGKSLGHPLLAPETCVRNDVTLGPAGTFLLVTGSNMSGKSTLLRAIGTNVALAQAGGPVCAGALRLPRLVVRSSMRLEDSLEEGVSYFMAELLRLRDIVGEAQQKQTRGEVGLLFLLDEVLRGTNSRERQIAVERVLVYLVGQGALGAIATHDLELAQDGRLAEVVQEVHFREHLEATDTQQRMTFDYLMRPGRATTTNALVLLSIVGLDADHLSPRKDDA